jgi:hypothetical protein
MGDDEPLTTLFASSGPGSGGNRLAVVTLEAQLMNGCGWMGLHFGPLSGCQPLAVRQRQPLSFRRSFRYSTSQLCSAGVRRNHENSHVIIMARETATVLPLGFSHNSASFAVRSCL